MAALLRLGVAVVAVALGIAGCDSNRSLITSTVPPYTEGTISAIDPTLGYLIEGRGSGLPPRAYVRVTSSTELRWQDDRPATLADLTVGRFVEAWSEGTVIDSQPPRAVARFIRVFATPQISRRDDQPPIRGHSHLAAGRGLQQRH